MIPGEDRMIITLHRKLSFILSPVCESFSEEEHMHALSISPFLAGILQKRDDLGQCLMFKSSVFRSSQVIYKHPGSPPNLPIKEIVWETIIPSFKVTIAKGLRQTWNWKLNAGILSLGKALTI